MYMYISKKKKEQEKVPITGHIHMGASLKSINGKGRVAIISIFEIPGDSSFDFPSLYPYPLSILAILPVFSLS